MLQALTVNWLMIDCIVELCADFIGLRFIQRSLLGSEQTLSACRFQQMHDCENYSFDYEQN